MKWIFAIVLFISTAAIGQTEDSTKYIWYKFQYGSRMPRFWSDSAQHIPYGDTSLFAKPQAPGFIMMHTDKEVYRWDGFGWRSMGGGGVLVSDSINYSNVLNFGAVGDGVTDCTNAINAAINAGKRRVYMPTGTYLVNATYLLASSYKPKGIVLLEGTELFGDGPGKTIIKLADNPVGVTTDTTLSRWWPVVHGSYVSNVYLHDFEINGNNANQIIWNSDAYLNPTAMGDTARQISNPNIAFKSGSNNVVHNVYSHHSQDYGTIFLYSSYGLVDNSKLSSNGSGGVGTLRTSDYTVISNSHLDSNWSDNIRIEYGDHVSVRNCVVTNTRLGPGSGNTYAGIYLEQASYCELSGNYAYGNSSYGIDINNGVLGNFSKYNKITSNFIYDNVHGGMLATGDVIIDGNTFYKNGSGSDYAIICWLGENWTITNNRAVSDATHQGRFIDGNSVLKNSVVSDNIWTGMSDSSTLIHNLPSDANVLTSNNRAGLNYHLRFPSYDAGGLSLQSTGSNTAIFLQNAIYNNGYKYKATGQAAGIAIENGGISFFVAPSGSPGGSVTFDAPLTVPNSGIPMLKNGVSVGDGVVQFPTAFFSYPANGGVDMIGVTSSTLQMGWHLSNLGDFSGTGRQAAIYDYQVSQYRFGINSLGDIYFGNGSSGANFKWENATSNLGLGTTSPATILHAVRSGNAFNVMRFDNTNAGSLAAAGMQYQTDGGSSYIYRTSTAYIEGLGNSTVIQDNAGGDIVLYGAAEIARFKNGGNMLVGTTSDNGALGQFDGDVTVADDPYDATGWNGNNEVPTKNAIRDKIESLSTTTLYTGDGTLAGNRTVSGNSNSLQLGAFGSQLSGLSIWSAGGIALNGQVSYLTTNHSTDANLTVPANVSYVELHDNLTTNRTVTMPTASSQGQVLTIVVRASGGSNHFNLASGLIDNKTGSTFTQLDWGTTYVFYVNASVAWSLILKY